MNESRRVTACVGIDVSKDRLDMHVLLSGEAFAVARDGKGLEVSSDASGRSTCR